MLEAGREDPPIRSPSAPELPRLNNREPDGLPRPCRSRSVEPVGESIMRFGQPPLMPEQHPVLSSFVWKSELVAPSFVRRDPRSRRFHELRWPGIGFTSNVLHDPLVGVNLASISPGNPNSLAARRTHSNAMLHRPDAPSDRRRRHAPRDPTIGGSLGLCRGLNNARARRRSARGTTPTISRSRRLPTGCLLLSPSGPLIIAASLSSCFREARRGDRGAVHHPRRRRSSAGRPPGRGRYCNCRARPTSRPTSSTSSSTRNVLLHPVSEIPNGLREPRASVVLAAWPSPRGRPSRRVGASARERAIDLGLY